MVDKILTAAGLPGRRGRFIGSALTYVVWFDDVTVTGSDDAGALVTRHDATLELYEDKPNDAAEATLEAAILAEGLIFTKQDRYWIQSEQMYQVIYEFTHYEKRRA